MHNEKITLTIDDSSPSHIMRPNVYNTEEFYKEQIEKLKESKKKLTIDLIKLQKESSKTNSLKTEKEAKEAELKEANTLIEQYKREAQKRKEQESAKSAWKANIEESFSSLKEHLTPVKSQKDKLTNVYHCFAWVTGGCITAIIIYTIFLCCFFWNIETGLTWIKYITKVFPFPIFGGILWFSVVQFNRAQRQMVELSHFIYEADYIEGLLLTLNTLSTDVSESARQINRTIETLISNHISLKDNCSLDEKKIKNLENQDYVPTKVLYKVLESLNINVNKDL